MNTTHYTLRRATLDDTDAIAAVLQAGKHENLPPEERAQRGFVQGNMSPAMIKQRFEHGFGGVVAVRLVDNQIVGANLYADAPTDVHAAHPLAGVAQTLLTMQQNNINDAAGIAVTIANTLMFGPLAVNDDATGNGLARALIEAIIPIARERGKARMISFVQNDNLASLAVHHKVGLTVLREYEFADKKFSIFTMNV